MVRRPKESGIGKAEQEECKERTGGGARSGMMFLDNFGNDRLEEGKFQVNSNGRCFRKGRIQIPF